MSILLMVKLGLLSMMVNDSIPVVTPDDRVVSGKNIPAYTHIWEMTLVNPDGKVIHRGIWEDEVSFFDRHGKEILKRVQHVHYKDKTSVQIEEVFRDNLKHIRLEIYTEGEEPHTDIYYEGNRIWGKKIFRVDGLDEMEQFSISFSYELPHPVFDWHLWGILISGFPLTHGYKARFMAHESYSYLPGDFRWFTLKVTGQEIIDGGKWGNVNCWTVEVLAEVKWKLWIAVAKDVAPVQQICIYDTDEAQYWWKPQKQNK